MSECSYCGKTILFGGRTIEKRRYCGAACASRHGLLELADQVPHDVLRKHAQAWRAGVCPKCRKNAGPVDVYAEHRVHSFVLITQWRSRRTVCCRRCGRLCQLRGALYSAALGWWGFPWGLLVTPVQIARNVAGMAARAPEQPTPSFERLVRLQLAQAHLRQRSKVRIASVAAGEGVTHC